MKPTKPDDIDLNLELDDVVPTLREIKMSDNPYDKLKEQIDEKDMDGWFKRTFPTPTKRLLAAVAVAFVAVLVLGSLNKYLEAEQPADVDPVVIDSVE